MMRTSQTILDPTLPCRKRSIWELAQIALLLVCWVGITSGGGRLQAQPRSVSEHWAFRPVVPPSIPAVKQTPWVQSPVDCFLLAGLEEKGLSPAPAADRRTLLRRATYDLIGLPPTAEELEAFLNDDSPSAFAKVVDRLLASPAYGERWGRHWLDVVRYADARDLIQLPVESDFREAWRFRDWVVEAHNRDLPYGDFVRHQIAGDLLQPADPEQLDADALVATGLLAIADFVPGDVDKDLMIADYVNDQIDVVGRAFLGLTLGCARCHDHKFDPITMEDYYALGGIFFSTRLIPSPVPGNTPLVRVPLIPKAEVDRIADRKKRVTELEKQAQALKLESDLEYASHMERMATTQTAQYLKACWEYHRLSGVEAGLSVTAFATSNRLHPKILSQWLEYLDLKGTRAITNPETAGRLNGGQKPAHRADVLAGWFRSLGTLQARAGDRAAGEAEARQVEKWLVQSLRDELEAAATKDLTRNALERSEVLRLRAKDARPPNSGDGRVTFLPNRSRTSLKFATVTPGHSGPIRTNLTLEGVSRPALRFTGSELLEVPMSVPAAGSLILVYRVADAAAAGQRVIGWEDSGGGRHGIGLMPTPGGGVHAILRKEGKSGDIVDGGKTNGPFEVLSLTWGEGGATLHRQGIAVGKNTAIGGVSSDPEIRALRVGGPGSGGSAQFRGDIAELRVYTEPLDEKSRAAVEKELLETWVHPNRSELESLSSMQLFADELCSPSGPYWLEESERRDVAGLENTRRLERLRDELAALRRTIPTNVPQAVVVQDGGPAGTRHEGFKDAQIYLRGDPKKLGKTVPRGLPKAFVGSETSAITLGSGRLLLADWIASPKNPLTARVAVNRIWQHHFGEGLVRTAANFGKRGDRPTHPELLDYLAARFLESGGSMKAMHRLLMLSAAYQQSSVAARATLAADPENLWLGRMGRTRLDAESLRDGLLFVAGRLNTSRGGPGFLDVATPRRTLYLMSVRTGNKSEFASVFDSPDCGAVVERRSVSTVAPQALFFLNDPFTHEQASALARRIRRETGTPDVEDCIRTAYRLVFGRRPNGEELGIGQRLLSDGVGTSRLERYCQLLLSANELIYVD